jgi:hypothetical protein
VDKNRAVAKGWKWPDVARNGLTGKIKNYKNAIIQNLGAIINNVIAKFKADLPPITLSLIGGISAHFINSAAIASSRFRKSLFIDATNPKT